MSPADPGPPLEPIPPAPEECCGSGCDPCVFDLYELKLVRYRQALQAWRLRQASGSEVL